MQRTSVSRSQDVVSRNKGLTHRFNRQKFLRILPIVPILVDSQSAGSGTVLTRPKRSPRPSTKWLSACLACLSTPERCGVIYAVPLPINVSTFTHSTCGTAARPETRSVRGVRVRTPRRRTPRPERESPRPREPRVRGYRLKTESPLTASARPTRPTRAPANTASRSRSERPSSRQPSTPNSPRTALGHQTTH